MFRIEMLPAAHGDCLWIEYGTGREVHRILIDGGPAHTYPTLRERILHLPGVAETVNMDHILRGYYSIKALNPSGIVPDAPDHINAMLSPVVVPS